eukprot:Rhum_TRINITY_DN16521_c0_g1::Rhum_TRINITY_DN16521_c0_g1_i1::g.163503::m.163503
MMPGMMKLEFDPNADLIRDPEVGLVLPPWAPPQMRVQMASMPVERKREIFQQQVATVKAALKLDASDVPTDEHYKEWLKIEFRNMQAMMASKGGKGGGHNHSHGGNRGGHSHNGKPCQGHGAQSHGGHDHGGHSHDGAHGGHSHGGGHSHNGVPCQGHGGQSHGGHGHSHGGGGGGMGAPNIDGLLKPSVALQIPEKIDSVVAQDDESQLVLPKWIPAAEQAEIMSMSVQRRKALRRHQVLSIRASTGALQGTMEEPTAADLSEPSDEETKQWVMREWTKINLMKAGLAPALTGYWVYGRRADGNLSQYSFVEEAGKMWYRELTVTGDVLKGEVVAAADGPTPPESVNFKAVWAVALENDKGMMWFRPIDGATIQSLFVHEGAAAKGFKAAARRAWASLAGAPETPDILLAGDLATDPETGLVCPPWAPDVAHKQLKAMPLEARQKMKAMQDSTVRQMMRLSADAPVTLPVLKEWIIEGYKTSIQQQQKMAAMSEQQKDEFFDKKRAEQEEVLKTAAAASASVEAPKSAEEADIQSQLAAINQMVMQNMQIDSKKAGPALD